MSHKNKSEMAACGQICIECARVCGEAISACYAKKDLLVDKELIECLIDCMTICQTSASLLMRASSNHGVTCQAVAAITERCAKNCERFDDPDLQRCADECLGAAASCNAMCDSN